MSFRTSIAAAALSIFHLAGCGTSPSLNLSASGRTTVLAQPGAQTFTLEAKRRLLSDVSSLLLAANMEMTIQTTHEKVCVSMPGHTDCFASDEGVRRLADIKALARAQIVKQFIEYQDMISAFCAAQPKVPLEKTMCGIFGSWQSGETSSSQP